MLSKFKKKLKTNETKNRQKPSLNSKFTVFFEKKNVKSSLKKSESIARSYRKFSTVYKREQSSKLFAHNSRTVKSSELKLDSSILRLMSFSLAPNFEVKILVTLVLVQIQ